ncbi:hypothetical protein KIT90_23100 [Vibrio sp. B172a]|uniref:hypothetical protein n=1 Tax=Vibrio TaxID=662 RepID=UPI000586C09C|nr:MULTISPECIES: hypothetical protein [Vibrio]EJU9973283.1 hypothetical protein [Vibrio alginolyticus]ELA6790662.1 hypothetical protein [Vibrio alginolyticus]ELA7918157.1 hypothetical protein [Vibrio alginolyticus]ELA8374524.1 hypothetical protein [Vibrio alginolyticus]MCG6322449.1 hypothetical protein [Vibrio alginolyticus]
MYIKFIKENLSNILPEKRPGMVFSNPDLFIIFDNTIRFVIWEEILEKLNEFWLEGKDTWDSNFDFGSNPDDYDRQFDDYKTIELLQFPTLTDLEVEEKYAFVFNENNELYISENFVKDLKSAGCVDVWYDTTAPYGRY